MNWVSIGSCNGLSPVRRQTITWTNTDLLSIRPLGTNISEIGIKIPNFSFMKMHLKTSSAKWRPFFPRGDDAELDVFFDLCLNNWLIKQSRRWWFETPSNTLWRHCNVVFLVGLVTGPRRVTTYYFMKMYILYRTLRKKAFLKMFYFMSNRQLYHRGEAMYISLIDF